MNKTMEYMAFELPVVAFDLSETRVSAADAAVYVEPNDVDEYAEAIVELLDDEPRRERMGRLGREPGRAGARLEHQQRAYVGVYADRWCHGARAVAGLRGLTMCGIAGCYQQPDGKALADAMTDRIAHRGPDATGSVDHRGRPASRVHLAHRRLSIIDLSDGGGPAVRQDGLTISYNGELYNYRELRAELAVAGVAASGPAPTPRWCWRRGGAGARTRCRGSAGCSRSRCYDERTGSLVLARDPLGIKPLYFLPPRRRRGLRLRAEGARRARSAPSCASTRPR